MEIIKSATCLIPCYNEAPRIQGVLDEMLDAECFTEIIVVDDGSTDDTAKIVRDNYPTVTLVKHSANRGKSEALKTGLNYVETEYVAMVDADLQGIKAKEMQRAVETAVLKDYDMIVLRRISHPLPVKLVRGDILITGERIIKTDLMKEIFNELEVEAYQIEFAMNDYALKKRVQCGWVPHSGMSVPWTKKADIWTGIKKEYDMYIDIFTYIGFKDLLKQYMFFCREEAN